MATNITPEELWLYCTSADEPECETVSELLKDELALTLLGEDGLKKLYERFLGRASSAE